MLEREKVIDYLVIRLRVGGLRVLKNSYLLLVVVLKNFRHFSSLLRRDINRLYGFRHLFFLLFTFDV
jgi:hypothetical protein